MQILDPQISHTDPVRLQSDDPEASVWGDGKKVPQAIIKRIDEWVWFQVTNIVTYRFPCEPRSDTIYAEVFLTSETPMQYIQDVYHRTVLPLVLQVYGYESMHGAALAYCGEAVLLCAPSRTGKSTMAFSMASRGARVIADDGLVWRLGESPLASPRLFPIPFQLMLREESATHFDQETYSAAFQDASKRLGVNSLPIGGVLFLNRTAVDEVTSERLGPSDAFKRLLHRSYTYSLADMARKRSLMASYLRFTSSVPVHLLTYPSGLDKIDQVVDHAQRLIEESLVSSPAQAPVAG